MSGDFKSRVLADAESNGISRSYVERMGQIESQWNPSARAKTSTAGGLFQFLDGTWNQYGGGADKMDPDANGRAMVRLTKDNQNHFLKKMGRPPADWELYLSHQQGAGGATELLSNPDESAVDVLTRVHNGNRELARQAVVNNGGREDMTAGAFTGKWEQKWGNPRGSGRTAGSVQRAAVEAGAEGPRVTQSRTVYDPSVGTPTMERDSSQRMDPRDLDSVKLRDVGSAEQRQVQERGNGLPPVGPDGGFNFNRQQDEYRQPTGWWAGTKIAFEDNLVVRGWKNYTAPAFAADLEYRRFDDSHVAYVREKGITDADTIGRITGGAVSRANLDYLIRDEIAHREDKEKMQDFSLGSRLVLGGGAALLDPTLLIPGVAAYKGLAAVPAAYRATTTVGRLAEGGLVSLVGSAPNIAGKFAMDERYTGNEALLEAGMAVALGGMFHLKYGSVGQEVQDYARKQSAWATREIAKDAGAVETEAGKAYFMNELGEMVINVKARSEGKTAGAAAGADVNQALVDKAQQLKKTSDYFDVSDAAAISRTGNVEVKAIFDELVPDPINRAAGARTLDFSAWEIGVDIRDRALATFNDAHQRAFEELLKLDNVKIGARAQTYGDFNEAVTRQVRSPQEAADPLVEKAAAAMRKANDDIAEEIIALKGTKDKNGNLIPWVESFEKQNNYAARIIDNDKASAVFNRQGTGYVADGVAQLVKQSGSLMEQLKDKASSIADRVAGKAAKKDAGAARDAAKPVAEAAETQAALGRAAGRIDAANAAKAEADDFADILKGQLDDLAAERELVKKAYAQHSHLERGDGLRQSVRNLDAELATIAKEEAAVKLAHAEALKAAREITKTSGMAKTAAKDIARKDIQQATSAAGKQAYNDTFAKKYQEVYLREMKANIDDLADRIGWRYARTIQDVVSRPQAMTAVSGTQQEVLVEAARRQGISTDMIDRMIQDLYPAGKTGPANTRRRLAISDAETVMVADSAGNMVPFTLGDLLDNDAASIMSKYTQGIVMDIGLAAKGYGSYGQYRTALDDAFINNGLANSYAHGVAKRVAEKAYGLGGKDAVEELIGDTASSVLRGAQAMATASFGGNFAVGAVMEPAQLVKRFGTNVIYENTGVKELANAVRKGGKEADDIYHNIQLMFGIGFQTKTNRVFKRWEGIGDHLDVGGFKQAARMFEQTAKNLATATTTGLGMVPATDMSKLAGARTLLQTMHDLSLGKAVVGPGKFRTRRELLDELGVSDDMLKASRNFFEHFKTDADGLVIGSKAEFDKAVAAAPAEWNTIRLLVRRADRSGIASEAPGVLPWWYDNAVGKTLGQFMTFSFLTHNYATVNDWNVGKAYAVNGLAITIGAGMLQNVAMSYARSLGKSDEDRAKYLEKQLGSAQAFLTNAYGRAPTSGLIPTLVDTTGTMTGLFSLFGMDEAPFSNSRLSGIESRTVGISAPVVQLGLGLKGLAELPADAARSDKLVTQQQAKNISSWLPAKSFLPIAVALDYGFSQLPKQEPVAQTLRNKNSQKESLIK